MRMNVQHQTVTNVAREWVMRLASGDMDTAEMTAFKTWLAAPGHRAAFETERDCWQALEPVRAPLAQTLPRPRRAPLRLWATGAAALAACLLLLMATDPLNRLRADAMTGTGDIRRVALPDGSVALLNTDSALAVQYTATARRITLLKGEAWFRVRHDVAHPFEVAAAGRVVRDIGTAFAMRRENDGVTVSVTEGMVAVKGGGGDETLTAGHRASYEGERSPGVVRDFDPATSLSWRDGRLVIDRLPLAEALAELGRYRQGRILLLDSAHATTKVSGVLALDRLDQGLDGLASAQGLRVTRITPYLVILR